MNNKQFILDTSFSTENLGDYIIMDAVNTQLRRIFPDDFFVFGSTHDVLGKKGHSWAKNTQYQFIGGSNLLSGRFIGRNHAQWRFGFRDLFYLKNLIGIGLGWQSDADYHEIYNYPFVFAQKQIYKKSLSNTILPSVRDSFTKKKLAEYGVESINTACVTMWDLTPEHLQKIPVKKSDTVIMTITDYRNDKEYMIAYKNMIEILCRNYKTVKMWIQSSGDIELLNNLKLSSREKIQFISPNLEDYDSELENDVDYVGTRLHAGIRALQHQKRVLVIEIDNRAREIAKDTNLNTLSYKNLDQLEEKINNDMVMNLTIPFEEINRWKQQFN